jgi:hypothetical protein
MTGYRALLGAFLLAAAGPRAGADTPFRTIWRGTGGWGNKSAYCSLFDPKNVETLQGVVASIEDVTPLPGMTPGVQLRLKTAKETIPVHLGPRWYLEHQDFSLNPEDKIEVTGSRIVCEGRHVIAASEIRAGSQVMHLRDASGRPLWTAAAPR